MGGKLQHKDKLSYVGLISNILIMNKEIDEQILTELIGKIKISDKITFSEPYIKPLNSLREV